MNCIVWRGSAITCGTLLEKLVSRLEVFVHSYTDKLSLPLHSCPHNECAVNICQFLCVCLCFQLVLSIHCAHMCVESQWDAPVNKFLLLRVALEGRTHLLLGYWKFAWYPPYPIIRKNSWCVVCCKWWIPPWFSSFRIVCEWNTVAIVWLINCRKSSMLIPSRTLYKHTMQKVQYGCYKLFSMGE
jgi:hypothetical protein